MDCPQTPEEWAAYEELSKKYDKPIEYIDENGDKVIIEVMYS